MVAVPSALLSFLGGLEFELGGRDPLFDFQDGRGVGVGLAGLELHAETPGSGGCW